MPQRRPNSIKKPPADNAADGRHRRGRASGGLPSYKKKRKLSSWLYVIIWVFSLIMFTGVLVIQMSTYNGYRRELAAVESDLENERQAHQDLLDRIVYNESDAYIEQQAREQLGLVRPDEILIINEAE